MLLLVPDIADTITHNRVEAFQEAGHDLLVVGFRRGRYERPDPPGEPHVTLGRTADRSYAQRLLAVLAALPRLFSIRHRLCSREAIYARNIDQLVLAMFCRVMLRVKAPIFYEVLDIQPIFVGSGLASRLFRLVERLCLGQVRLLVLSSGGFHDNFYLPVQRYQGRWFLLENKLPISLRSWPNGRDEPSRLPLTGGISIGCFGLIRGDATLQLIERLARRLHGVVSFHFAGIITSVDKHQFARFIRENDNVIYEGQYANPRDLPRLYGGVDFAWAIDLEHADGNSRWLMPCRFYEAGWFGVPCLAAKGFEVGRTIDELGCGWTFEAPYEDALVEFFRNLTLEQYRARQMRLLDLPESTFVAGSAADGLASILR